MKSRPLLLVTCVALSTAAAAATETRFWSQAAEAAEARGAVRTIEDVEAIGGRARRLEPGQAVTWVVEAPAEGRYELHLRYRTENRSLAAEMAVNGRRRAIGLAAGFGAWRETTRAIALQAGRNDVTFAATEAGFDVDQLRFTTHPRAQLHPLEESPAVAPRAVTRAAGATHDLRLFVRRAGHGTPAVRVGGQTVPARWEEAPELDDAGWLTIPAQGWSAATPSVDLVFPRGMTLAVPVNPIEDGGRAPLMIATLDVSHGKCTVLRLPDGTTAMLDTATAREFERTVKPFLQAHGITRIDHLIITHYHDDHSGGLAALRAALPVGEFRDYRSFRTGDAFELGGVAVRVLNAYDAGQDENSRSLSLRFEYRGFVYADGADIYGHNQERILREMPEAVRAHVYYGNHHFHGSVDVAYLRRTDPVLFLVSADPAVYARGAFTEEFEAQVESHLRTRGARLRETLLTPEVGHILLRIHDDTRWSYETRAKGAGAFAGLAP